MNEKELIHKAMTALGKRTSEKKRAAVRRNGAATRFVEKPLAELSCNCGAQTDDTHKTYCPRGRAYRRRIAQPVDERSTQEAAPEEDFADIAARKRERLRALMEAPVAAREAALKQSAAVASRYYETPEGANELANWRALQSEPFHE